MNIDFSRYRIMYYDEFVRLWCEDHYEDIGCELDIWSEISPIPVEDIIETIQVHEERCHSGETHRS